ncbi:MAG: PASTA domain-containing protein [Bacteroidales bacterium]|nr:PASTA domain-containing protein [Bacteroidales bacterium]
MVKKANDNKWILRNLIGAAVFVTVIVAATGIGLGILTKHNRSLIVPDFTNMTYDEARAEASRAGVKVHVSDSVFAARMKKGAVYSQHPKAGAEVKPGRTIELTVNANGTRKVTMPSLVGCSMRQAKAELASRGLTLGKLKYQADIATNNVLRQQYKGRDIAPGKLINAGSTIDLVCGLNYEDGRTYIPNLMGLSYVNAVSLLLDNSLNVGKLKFDKRAKSFSDSLACIVSAQSPDQSTPTVLMGTEVDLVLTLPKNE